MHKLTLSLAFVIAAFVTSGCGNTGAAVSTTAPTQVSVDALTLSVNPPAVDAQQVKTTFNFCPAVSPFTVPVNLVVLANGTEALIVTQITIDFVDVFGVRMPQVTLPAPALTTQFGTALVQARSSRTFPLTLGVGCGTTHTGTMRIGVDTTDTRGRQSSGHIDVTVR